MARKKSKKKRDMEEEVEEKKKGKGFSFTERQYQYAIVVLSVFLALSIAFNFMDGITGMAVMDANLAGQRAVMAINSLPQVIASGANATFVNATEYSQNMYEVITSWMDTDISIFVSKDGQYIYLSEPQSIDDLIDSYASNFALASSQTTQQQEVPKSDTPEVKLFVMSYCPYGLQAQKAMIPVMELLGSKADITIDFVDYTMHGWKEVVQNNNEYCIQRDEPDKFTAYLRCFVQSDDHNTCLIESGINNETLNACLTEIDSEFGITEAYESSTSSYPPYPIQTTENTLYGVGGSPTLVINGVQASPSSRSPEAFKETICSAFNNPPAECSQTLSSNAEAAGIGPLGSSSGSDSTASCG
jgi:hypothetical protein